MINFKNPEKITLFDNKMESLIHDTGAELIELVKIHYDITGQDIVSPLQFIQALHIVTSYFQECLHERIHDLIADVAMNPPTPEEIEKAAKEFKDLR